MTEKTYRLRGFKRSWYETEVKATSAYDARDKAVDWKEKRGDREAYVTIDEVWEKVEPGAEE